MNIKKNDTVIVLSGKDKGRSGKVMETIPKENKVIVEKINMADRHVRPKRQGEEGGIISKPIPLRANKVMRLCPKCGKPTRTAYKFLEDGTKTRVCKKCGETI